MRRTMLVLAMALSAGCQDAAAPSKQATAVLTTEFWGKDELKAGVPIRTRTEYDVPNPRARFLRPGRTPGISQGPSSAARFGTRSGDAATAPTWTKIDSIANFLTNAQANALPLSDSYTGDDGSIVTMSRSNGSPNSWIKFMRDGKIQVTHYTVFVAGYGGWNLSYIITTIYDPAGVVTAVAIATNIITSYGHLVEGPEPDADILGLARPAVDRLASFAKMCADLFLPTVAYAQAPPDVLKACAAQKRAIWYGALGIAVGALSENAFAVFMSSYATYSAYLAYSECLDREWQNFLNKMANCPTCDKRL
ncbi:MAG: hypothetical protein ABI877_22740 [Gemmatimonadaceae bacterium]